MNPLTNWSVVNQVQFTTNVVQRLVTTKQYDNLNPLTEISSAPSGKRQAKLGGC